MSAPMIVGVVFAKKNWNAVYVSRWIYNHHVADAYRRQGFLLRAIYFADNHFILFDN